MVPAETGENEVVYCESGQYAANIEKATSRGPVPATTSDAPGAALEKFATPGVVTIEALAQPPYQVPAERQIKTLVYIVESKPVLALLRGDDQMNEAKFTGVVGSNQHRPATPEEIRALLGASPGSLGALATTLPASAKNVPVHADLALRGASGMTTGANEDGFHFKNVAAERDLTATNWADLRTVRAGEACVGTGKPLKIQRAIEVGHVFKLGTKYSEKLNASYLDESGARKPCVMGCYGIGITRTLQAVIEQCHDKDGIIWPVAVAPYTVLLTPLAVAPESAVMKLAEQIYAELTAAGVDVILDDRDERPGVKFKDADLVGFPIRLAIGEKSLAKGEVELKRRGGALIPVKADQAVAEIKALLAAG
jgi:prolyl-tRNA synthetase